MKIARIHADGKTGWARIDEDAQTAALLNCELEDIFAAIKGKGVRTLALSAPKPLAGVTLLAPVNPCAKIVCVGLNYRSHVEAFGREMPDSPVAFLKAQSAVIPHDADLVMPVLTQKLDYEIELVAVMGDAPKPGACPADSIIGYTIGNDASARDLQHGPRGVDLYSSKSLDGTCGIGPWIVTVDEIGTAPDLAMELRVNGQIRQSDRTGSMEWSVSELLAYVQARSSLKPGDLVFTGTPAGVALESGVFLQSGDVVECQIESIGCLRNRITAPKGGGEDA
ncbi:fumarylacetoacetate hydrolase family protein [Henriciella sp.]|uniref:fumarylacetoacetate hydrolase family protein n=1 Tax=Henriciella sp. TaxID=1968823 RepID=UPI00263159DA|nr:fumarylacetoacetate hydrolase family protein [Henriciella sp.]